MNAGIGPRPLRVGILVFDGFEPLDVWGFAEAFSISRYAGSGYLSPPPYPFEIVLISNECRAETGPGRPKPVKSYNGPHAAPDWFRDEALNKQLDLLMIPGGAGVAALLAPDDTGSDEALTQWLRSMDARVQLLTSVCTGAALLARAGLLDGHSAATNHEAFTWVSSFGPRVLWDKLSRWVDAGRYVTSAGVSAGTDMAFYLVARLAGHEVAEAAARTAEYDWCNDPHGADAT
jgi:putative intracellular protease/amidase